MNRFSRNSLTISLEEQDILASKKVLVIGLGGLGSHVIEGLIRLGIENIGLCDFDVIDETNLNRQLLALEDNIGQSKVSLALKRIKSINSKVNVNMYNDKYPNNQIDDDINEYDLVIDCLDSIKTRLTLEKQCIENNIPLIYGTIAGNYGYFGIITQDNRLIENQSNIENSIEKKLGNPYYIVACVSALQVLLAQKVILNQEYLKNGFYMIDLSDLSIETIIVE